MRDRNNKQRRWRGNDQLQKYIKILFSELSENFVVVLREMENQE